MKKIYPLIFLLAVLCSCSSDDTAPIANEPDPTGPDPELTDQEYINSQLSGTPGFLKLVSHYDYMTIVYTSYVGRYYSYNGNKLSKIFYYTSSWPAGSDYTLSVYTYTGDLITQIEQKNRDNVVTSTTKYFYDEQQRLLKTETNSIEDFKTSEFTNNGDGSVSIVYKEANEAGELETVGTAINYYNNAGELIKNQHGNIETEITYDTSGNPLSLVTGLDKISIYGTENSHLHNIANIRTITHIEGEPDEIVDRPNTWTYNTNGFPIKQTTSYTNSNGQPSTNDYWYY